MNALINVFKIPDLRKKVLYTVIALVIYRIGAHIPTPGINPTQLFEYFRTSAGSMGKLLSIIDLFAGGSLFKFTIFGLGVMPYITASIVMNLFQMVVPALDKLAKEGETGRKKINQYTRYLAIFICIVQSISIAASIQTGLIGEGYQVVYEFFALHPVWFTLVVMITTTTGTMFLMWLGDQITENGIGNGMSLIIFAGIAARIPAALAATFQKVIGAADAGVAVSAETLNPLVLVILFLIIVVVTFFVVWEQSGQRRIPVQYAKRVVGRKVIGAQSTHIPFKINPAGVIPIIFASAIVTLPAMLAPILQGKVEWISNVLYFFQYGSWPYICVYFVLVIAFAYLYTSVQFNADDIADNLKRSGGFIPGIRPGTQTADYIRTVLKRITVLGSFFLGFIAVFPDLLMQIPIFKGVPQELLYLMGGTSLLILVSVALDTMKQIESQLQMHNYGGFMKKAKGGRR